jgi:UDP-GlcNAc:undecaprenyl-phosphate/decaprenyl-phosphate GlcNAc-1-phosphate transferase
VYTADRHHLHHRFVNIGFSQRRAATYIWLWCGTLAATALALRFIRPHQHGEWHPWRTLIVSAFGVVALAASVYMVYLLEIVKLANPIMRKREEQARARERKSA